MPRRATLISFCNFFPGGGSVSGGNGVINSHMIIEHKIRVLAGSMILLSLALAHWVSPWWLLLTAFVGVNLIQSAFTGFCPPEILLRKWSGKGDRPCCCSKASEEVK
jgi:hypothetical protein